MFDTLMILIHSPVFASMMKHTEIRYCLQSNLNGPNPEEQPRVTVARSVLKVTWEIPAPV